MRPNVALVILDSLRARNMPFLGYARPTMPFLTDLARDGVVFSNAFATSNWSLPSHASLFSGRLPRGHRVSHGNRRLPPDVPVLADLLGAAGYRTAAFTANPYVSDAFAMLRGFDRRFKSWQAVQTTTDVTSEEVAEATGLDSPPALARLRALLGPTALAGLVNVAYRRLFDRRLDAGGWRLVRAAREWVRQSAAETYFAVFNFMEAHLPYHPPVALARRFVPADATPQEIGSPRGMRTREINSGVALLTPRDREVLVGLYDGALTMLDERLAALVEVIQGGARGRETAVIVVADHGDLLGEDGLVGHEYSLADPLIHVPVVLWGPDVISGGIVRRGLVQVHDLFATILGLAGVQPPPGAESLDLLAGAGRPHVFAEYDRPLVSLRGTLAAVADPPRRAIMERGLAAARTERHKLVVGTDGSEALYDVSADPDESRNLIGSPDEPAGVRDRLADVISRATAQEIAGSAQPALDEDTRRALERFGYLT